MKTVEKRGAVVAYQLGWPRRDRGFVGAAGGLLDPFSDFRRAQSSIRLVRHYNRQKQLATKQRVLRSVRQQLTKA